MARECLKCGNHVPKSFWVDNKKRNCQRRKYCLECSPFGGHNTKKLELEPKERIKNEKGIIVKVCSVCNKFYSTKGKKCYACTFQVKQAKRSSEISDLVGGYSCWICGYNKCKRAIHFHHVDPTTKLFGLSTRELMHPWEKVLKELSKCIVVCSNCHCEIHSGMIDVDCQQILINRWSEIRDRGSAVRAGNLSLINLKQKCHD